MYNIPKTIKGYVYKPLLPLSVMFFFLVSYFLLHGESDLYLKNINLHKNN